MTKKHVTLTSADIKKMKREAVAEAVERSLLVFLTAAYDSCKLSEDDLIKIMDRANRYAEYIEENLVSTKVVKDIIQKNIGLRFVK